MKLFAIITLLLFTASSFGQGHPIEFGDLFGMGRVKEPQISPDGEFIAYTITWYDIEKNTNNSDIYLITTDGQNLRQLTSSPHKDFSPRWSPDGNSLAFISTRDGLPQIYLVGFADNEIKKLTDIVTGVESFSWSPNGKYVAVATDMYPEAQTPEESAEIDSERSDSLGTGKIFDKLLFRHWNEWRDGKYSRVLVVPVEGGKPQSLTPFGIDTPPISLGSDHDYVWAPNGSDICYVANHDSIVAISTNNDIWLTNRSGSMRQQISTGKGNDMGPRFSPDGNYVAYMSMARPGFEADQRDLMVYSLSSGGTQNLTETLDLSVYEFLWAPNSEKLYFQTPYHGRYRLYEVELNSTKRKMLLEGHHFKEMEISPDGNFLILARQAVNYPMELYRFDIGSEKLAQLTFTNKERLAELRMNPLEDYWFNGANDDSVHLMMVKPPDFDPSKKYPLICLIHGGPQNAWGDDFHYRWNAEMFASPGYVVIMINPHGSRGYGQKFCDAVSKNWGGWPFDDIMIGTKWALENFDFIDGDRVGAAGASYGGFMVNWIAGHNEEGLFKALVSHDGTFENVSFFGATEEVWFPTWEMNGYPWEEGSVYQKWNPVNYVDNFNTPMLVIHGEKDFRIPYTQAFQLFTALQIKGVDSRSLYFSDEDHWVRKPQNAQLWWKTVHDWLGKYLMP
jgi:dipeptidyl aminopeptidase/acylaminoacyl peptidase